MAKITKTAVDKLKMGATISDDEVKGFVARRRPGGVFYFFRYRSAAGKGVWAPLGRKGLISPDEARTLARNVANDIHFKGLDPQKEKAAAKVAARVTGVTVNAMLDQHIKLYVEPNLSTAFQVVRGFDKYVRPQIGDLPLAQVKRSHITKMLDKVEKDHGPVQADQVLAYVRKAFNWHTTRDDDFVSPVAKGMARTKPSERARERALDDQELRDVWQALDECDAECSIPQCYAQMLRMLLLTASRLRMVSEMTVSEVKGREWLVAKERMKTVKGKRRPFLVTLSDLALKQLPETDGPYAYSTTGGSKHFQGFTKAKAALDAKIAEIRQAAGREPMEHWTPHDLRRTARSLMKRGGVDNDICERVLAHVIGGVRGVYDVYDYKDEKRVALEKLAIEVERVLNPGKKVVAFPKRA